MTEAIEPCPFCGSEAIATVTDLWRGKIHWVMCRDSRNCASRGRYFLTRKEAIAAWNRVASQRWRPIATAPKDGTPLDLWIVPPSEAGSRDFPIFVGAHAHRIPDATPCYRIGWQSCGRTITGRRFYDDDGGECLDPDDTSARATRATNWRPLPDPPGDEP